MQAEGTLLLRRTDVEELLSLRDCIDAVEEIFRQQGNATHALVISQVRGDCRDVFLHQLYCRGHLAEVGVTAGDIFPGRTQSTLQVFPVGNDQGGESACGDCRS